MCSRYQIDLVFITESWTSDEDNNSSINLPGYKILSRVDKDSVTGRGGGILIYVNERLKNVHLVKEQKGDSNFPIQISTIQINSSHGNNIKVNLIYRSPNIPSEKENESIDAICNTMENNVDNLIIGDLNLPEVDYEDGSTKPYPGGKKQRPIYPLH